MDESLEFVVKRPRKDVFAGLTDLDLMARFAGDAKAPVKVTVEPVPDRPKAGKGSAVTVSIQGQGQPMLMETAEWDPPNRCVRTLSSPDLDGRVEFDFADDPKGTKVTARVQLTAKSFLLKMVLPVLAKRVASEKAQLADRLKDGIG